MLIIEIVFTLIIVILSVYIFFNPEKISLNTKGNSSGKWSFRQILIALFVLWAVVTTVIVGVHVKSVNNPNNLKIGRFNKGDMSPYFDEAKGSISLVEDSIFKHYYREGVITAVTVYKFDEPSFVNNSVGQKVPINTIYQWLLVDCENSKFLPTKFDVYSDDIMFSTNEGDTDMIGKDNFYSLDDLKGLYKDSIRKICSVYKSQYDKIENDE